MVYGLYESQAPWPLFLLVSTFKIFHTYGEKQQRKAIQTPKQVHVEEGRHLKLKLAIPAFVFWRCLVMDGALEKGMGVSWLKPCLCGTSAPFPLPRQVEEEKWRHREFVAPSNTAINNLWLYREAQSWVWKEGQRKEKDEQVYEGLKPESVERTKDNNLNMCYLILNCLSVT